MKIISDKVMDRVAWLSRLPRKKFTEGRTRTRLSLVPKPFALQTAPAGNKYLESIDTKYMYWSS